MSFPLSGVRVIDLTRLLPGAFATQMLAELGAEVIKVEDPRGGDPMRHLPPLIGGRGLYDLLINRGKKSVTLDLKDPKGAAALDRLLDEADIVIESFRPGAAKRLGVTATQIRQHRPRLVHCSITGYGQTGPYAERAGHDLNYVSLSGLLAADRPAFAKATAGKPDFAEAAAGGPAIVDATGERPQLPRMFIADVGGGAMSAVIGILAALVGRGRTGEGAAIDVSMHEASLYWMMLPAAPELVPRGPDGEAATGELPTFGRHASYSIYRTKDDQLVALGALEAKFWRAFCEGVDRPDLAARHGGGEADQRQLTGDVAAIFAARTQADWIDWIGTHDCCVTPVLSPAAALADPHVVARGAVQASGGMRTIRPPFVNRIPDLAPPPRPGQHNDEILGPKR